jgi:hypothetical protein
MTEKELEQATDKLRDLRRRGLLSDERIEKLDGIGFDWKGSDLDVTNPGELIRRVCAEHGLKPYQKGRFK